MSGPDLDKVTKELFDAARSEQPVAAKKDAILEEVLRNGVSPGNAAVPLSRWMTWAGFALLLIFGVLYAFSGGSEAEVVSPPQPPPLAQVTPSPPEPPPAVAPEPVSPSVEVAPPPPAVDPPPSPPPNPKPPPVEERDLLAEEVRLVDDARTRVVVEPLEALKVLERHRRRFPSGALKVEADLVRVEALLRSGKREEATKVSQRLISSDPNGPVAARAQRLMESIP